MLVVVGHALHEAVAQAAYIRDGVLVHLVALVEEHAADFAPRVLRLLVKRLQL